MNKRIVELARQAGLKKDHASDREYTGDFDWREFAELIVRECASVLKAESERLYQLASEEEDELFASNFEICAEKCVDNEEAIKQHFGVE
jgi:hypothetical protein